MRIAALSLLFLSLISASPHSDSAWFLPRDCSGTDLSLAVFFDGNTIFQTQGPACTNYSDNRDESWSKDMFSFSFHPEQMITWTGYRDDSMDSPVDAKLIIDLWLAGADAEEAVWFIGFSVRDDDLIYAKTIHSADLTGESESCLAEKLCVQTKPK